MKNDEKESLFASLKGIMDAIISEKKDQSSMKKFLQKKLKISLRLQVYKDYFLYVNLNTGDGTYSVEMCDEEPKDYTFQIRAAPEDLMWYMNKTYSLIKMTVTFNEFGKLRWMFKKGGRHPILLLSLAGLLVFDMKK
ncbi:MAG: hypothetical protein GY870_02345 [archaeon]|nr:hypothetical protein [archaeon]